MQVSVKLFGAVREAVGRKELALTLAAGARVADLRQRLARDHAIFTRYGARLAAAVNQRTAPEDTPLADGDEVAFLPPVAGGSADCWLSERPLDSAAVAPGFVMTPLQERTTTAAQRRAMTARIPLGRRGVPEDLVGSYLFLASEAMSGWITGATIDVNGGVYFG